MANQIVKQPNGKYAIWSTIVDDFTVIDATPEEIINIWADDARQRIDEKVRSIVNQLNVGGRPYHQFTMTFSECVALAHDMHDNTEQYQ